MVKKKVVTKNNPGQKTKPTNSNGKTLTGMERRLANLKKIKKGEVRNPTGKKGPQIKNVIKNLTREELANCIELIFLSNVKEIKRRLKDSSLTITETIIMRAALDAAEHGKYEKFEIIMQRLIGKVPDKVDVTSGGEKLKSSEQVDLKNVQHIVREMVKKIDDDV